MGCLNPDCGGFCKHDEPEPVVLCECCGFDVEAVGLLRCNACRVLACEELCRKHAPLVPFTEALAALAKGHPVISTSGAMVRPLLGDESFTVTAKMLAEQWRVLQRTKLDVIIKGLLTPAKRSLSFDECRRWRRELAAIAIRAVCADLRESAPDASSMLRIDKVERDYLGG